MKKIVGFLILFILIIGCSSCCFGATSYNQINEVLNDLGYSDMPVDSNVTSALSQNCAVFFSNYNSNNEPTRVTVMYDKYSFFPVYLQKEGSGTSTYYRIYASNNTGWLYFHYYDINTTTKELTYGGSLGTGNYPRMTSFSNYSSSISIDEFNTYAFQKKVLNNSLIYLPSNQGLYFKSSSGTDIYYVWDGKWDGTSNGTQMDIYGGSFTFSGIYLYYYYESGLNEPIDLSIELNSYYPASLKNLSKSSFPENNGDKYDLIYAGTEFGYSYYYIRLYDLIEKCENGMISRMTATASEVGESGEVTNVTLCTSEFFGINNWKSNTYKIRNLLDYINIPSEDLENEDSGSSSSSSSEDRIIIIDNGISSGDMHNLTSAIGNLNNNLINSGDLKDMTNNIADNFNNTILGTPNENGDREGGLVGNLLSGLWRGLVSLIVPTTEQFGAWITDTYGGVNSRGGILLYSKEFWVSLLGLINNEDTGDLIFTLPEFKIPTSDVVIWEEINFNVNDSIEQNETINGFYTTYIIIVSGISIYYFCQYLWSLWQSLINGTPNVEVTTNEEIDGWDVGRYGNVKMPHYKTTRNIKFK